ncbi:MAG: alpha-amylase family glycosyl hydrolase [Pseudomonadota bacterium]
MLAHADGGVVFTFDSATASTVAVAGTFNCWVGDDCPLTQVAPGRWQTTLAIATGRHLYKYVIDGRDWIRDPANGWISEDGQDNSSFTVDEFGHVLLRAADTGPLQPGPMYLRHAALASPAWLADAVLYQLSLDAFGGSFAALGARLAYLAELGVNTIWMMPVHPRGIERRQGRYGDPYAVRDFGAIDPRYGDADDLRALVEAVHARGMRIVLDWTLNRSSIDNALTAQHPDWFTRKADGAIFYAVPNRDCFAGFDFGNRALRDYLLGQLCDWVGRFGFDGLRLDDSDITPLDFLNEIRVALAQVKPDIALVSQAYDEFHHLASCDLTYEGGMRDVIGQPGAGNIELQRYWEASTYSFPRGALRLRWLEDKEQGRAKRFFGDGRHLAAVAIQLTLDGVPHILMGQEFDEPRWNTWTCLFDDFALDWSAFDQATFAHYRALLRLRASQCALRGARIEFLAGLAPQMIGYWRGEGAARLLVLVNLAPHAQAMPEPAIGLEPLYALGLMQSGTGLEAYGCAIVHCA